MQKQFTTKDNITLHYEVFGDDASPVILLIMGLGMPAVAWPKGFIEGLVRAGFRVITFDNRDCGKSTKFNEDIGFFSILGAIFKVLCRLPVRASYSLSEMAADAEAVLDEVQVKRAHVVGISMGGMIAQVMSLHSPHRVASMVSMMSASGNPRTGFGRLRAIRALLSHPKDCNTEEAVTEYLRKLINTIGSGCFSHSEEHLRTIARYMVQSQYEAMATSRQLLAILSSGDRSKSLGRIMTPTLVIHGKQDPLLPVQAGEEVANSIPNARMLKVNAMGHDLSEEVLPEILSAVIKHCHRYKD